MLSGRQTDVVGDAIGNLDFNNSTFTILTSKKLYSLNFVVTGKAKVFFTPPTTYQFSWQSVELIGYSKATCTSNDTENCKMCINKLNNKIWGACKYTKDAKIWDDICSVEYSLNEII